jgi:uncharacterized heparinase superfamily protein
VRAFLCLTGVSLVLAGCGTDPEFCTGSIEPAITVRALAAGSGENVTNGAQGTVSEDSYSDSLRPALFDPAQRVMQLRAADERPGTYGLWVERDGYQAVSLSGIEVTMGECHVNTEAVDVTMTPIP